MAENENENQNQEENGNGKKSKKTLIIIIVLVVVLLAVIAGVAMFVLSRLGGDDADFIHLPPGGVPIEDITFINLSNPINTNLLQGIDGRTHFVSLNFSIGVLNTEGADSADLIALLNRSEPVVRNIALMVIRDMTFQEVISREGAGVMTDEILRRLQNEFATNLIVGVYLEDLMPR